MRFLVSRSESVEVDADSEVQAIQRAMSDDSLEWVEDDIDAYEIGRTEDMRIPIHLRGGREIETTEPL